MPALKTFRPLNIAGIGRYLPERIVTNAELAERCQRSAEWILERNGVLERRWVGHETASYMGARAAEEALKDARLSLKDIDLILNASGTTEQSIPDTSTYIQRQLGEAAYGIPGMTLHVTCLSFIAALEISSSLLLSGNYQNILIVSSEAGSVALNPDEPESFSLIGDGAAAVVVRATGQTEGAVMASRFETHSEAADSTVVRGGGTRWHPHAAHTKASDNLFHMEGMKVLRAAYRYAPAFLERLRPGLSQGLDDVDWVIPHQASKIGLRYLESFGWPSHRIVKTIQSLGNCIAASVPLTLYEAIKSQRLQPGQTALLVGTGAGLSLGGVILRY